MCHREARANARSEEEGTGSFLPKVWRQMALRAVTPSYLRLGARDVIILSLCFPT